MAQVKGYEEKKLRNYELDVFAKVRRRVRE